MKKAQIISHLKRITNDLKEELIVDPYFIITEGDLQGWLYTRLLEIPDFNGYFTDYEGNKIFKIHLEYPRIWYAYDTVYMAGFYDISILKKPSKNSPLYETTIDRLPSYLAFELKAKWEETDQKVMKRIGYELTAFKKNRNHISSDYGVVLHANIARKSKGDLNKIQKCLDRHKKKHPHVFFIYIESYPESDDQKNEPEILYSM